MYITNLLEKVSYPQKISNKLFILVGELVGNMCFAYEISNKSDVGNCWVIYMYMHVFNKILIDEYIWHYGF